MRQRATVSPRLTRLGWFFVIGVPCLLVAWAWSTCGELIAIFTDDKPSIRGTELPPPAPPVRVARDRLTARFSLRLVDAEIASSASRGVESVRSVTVEIVHSECIHLAEGDLRFVDARGSEIARVPFHFEHLWRACQAPMPKTVTVTVPESASSPVLVGLMKTLAKPGDSGAPAGRFEWVPSRVENEVAE